MRKVIILGLVALVLAVISYFALFYVPSNDAMKEGGADKENVVEEGSNVKDTSGEPRSGIGTLSTLRLLNEDLECTISYTSEDQASDVEGTYFVSDGNIRGDFLTDSPDLTGQVLSSMIINGSTMYTWSEIEGQAYGMRIDLSTVDQAAADSQQVVTPDSEVKYDCKSWETVDQAVFVPPSDVLFQDMSDLMEAGMEEPILYEEGAELPY